MPSSHAQAPHILHRYTELQTLIGEARDAPKRPSATQAWSNCSTSRLAANGEHGEPSLQVRAPVVWEDTVASDAGYRTGTYLLRIPRAAVLSPRRPRLLLRSTIVHAPALSGGSVSPVCHRGSSGDSGSGGGSGGSSGMGGNYSDGGGSTQQCSNNCNVKGSGVLWEGHLPDIAGRVDIAVGSLRADGRTGSLKKGKTMQLPGKTCNMLSTFSLAAAPGQQLSATA